MTVEELTAYFPKEAGIARYGKPEETKLMRKLLKKQGFAPDVLVPLHGNYDSLGWG
jgi:hypothetical protein